MKELLLPGKTQHELGTTLFRRGLFGIHEDPDQYITLKSGRKSPHYLNARIGLSNVHVRDLIVSSLIKLTGITAVDNRACDYVHEAYAHVVGTPEAMTTYAGIIGHQLRLSILQPRVDMTKASGNKDPILGVFDPGDAVVAYDDVVTDGGSKITTIEALRAQGLDVADYLVLLDRQEGGVAQVEEATGLSVTPAIGVSGLVAALRSEDLITDRQFTNVREYLGQYGDPGVVEHLDAQLQ